jgi:flagellar basal body rod protein FlgC
VSSIWSGIDIAGSGAEVDQTWIDTIGGNVANMNDAVTPGQSVYQAQYVQAAEQVDPGSKSMPSIWARPRGRSSTTRPIPWRMPKVMSSIRWSTSGAK